MKVLAGDGLPGEYVAGHDLVHVRPDPDRHLVPVARAVFVGEVVDVLLQMRTEDRHHLLVVYEVTGRQYDALPGTELQVLTSLVLSDDADDAARIVADQLLGDGAVVIDGSMLHGVLDHGCHPVVVLAFFERLTHAVDEVVLIPESGLG